MDPLSITSSIAGLMTLADIVFRRTYQYVRAVEDAKKDVQNLANEIRALAGILHNLSLTASALEDEEFDQNLRMHHVNACRHTLMQIDKRLSKTQGDFTGHSKLAVIKRKLKWPFSAAETKELLQETTRHKDTISLALSADSMNAILRCLTRQEDIDDKMTDTLTDIKRVMAITTRIDLGKKRQRVLDFFTKVNPQPNFETSRGLRHPMTGLWLTESQTFKSWLHTEETGNSRLWLSGIPGAGKTVLAGSIIEETLKESDSSVAVAFFFCNHGSNLSRVPTNILGTLAAQIAKQSDQAFSCLDQYYRELHPSRNLSSSPSRVGLIQAIQDMAEGFDHVLIVVDGLDECGDETDNVVEDLYSLSTSGNFISIALLSRNEQNIRAKLEEDFYHIEIAAHKEDLQLYVPAEIEKRIQTKKLRIKSASFKDEIIRKLVNDADGMFRWVACQLDYLCELPNDTARRAALDHLPPTLNATYERILERINNSNEHIRAMVQKALQLIAWSPMRLGYLTIVELCEAISISETTTSLDSDDLIDVDEVTLRCSSLVRTSHDGRYLEFAHFTVREFLEGHSLLSTNLSFFHLSDDQARDLLSETGLRFLNFPEFSKSLERGKSGLDILKHRNESHPFYYYVCRYLPWILLPKQIDKPKILELAKQLFGPTKRPNLVAWSLNLALYLVGNTSISGSAKKVKRYNTSKYLVSDSASDSDSIADIDYVKTLFSAFLRVDFTPLHLAAGLGLFKVCEYLVNSGADVNLQSDFGTPLHCAIGCVSIFDDRDISLKFPVYDYFHIDARVPIIDLFLAKGAKGMEHIRTPYWRARFSTLALQMSYAYMSWGIFTHLLEIGMPLDETTLVKFEHICNKWFKGPLRHAKDDANVMVEKILNSTSNLRADNSAIARLYSLTWDFGVKHRVPHILAQSDDLLPDIPEMSDESFFMAITIAIEKDDAQFVKGTFNDPRLHRFQQWNEHGYTLSHLATKHRSVKCLESLFDHDLYESARDEYGRFPIHLCETNGHEDVLRVLVHHGVPTTSLDRDGKTLWHVTAYHGSLLVLLTLIQNKGEMDQALGMTTTDGHTPLSYALYRDNRAVALFLLEVCDQEDHFQSPVPLLNYAATMASEDFIEKLIKAGEKPCHEDPTHPTPLNFVTREVSLSCLELLKSLYPNFPTGLANGETALEGYLARELKFEGDHKEIVAELLGAGDIASQTSAYKKLWEFFCSAKVVQPAFFGADPVAIDGINDILDLFLERGVMATFENETKLSGLQPLAKTIRDVIRRRPSPSPRSANRLAPAFNLDSRIIRTFPVLRKVVKETQYFHAVADDTNVVIILRLAVIMGTSDITLELLGKGIDVHRYADDGVTALHMACVQQTSCGASLFGKILEHADKRKLDHIHPDFDLSLVHSLGGPGIKDAVPKLELLINAGANPNIRTRNNSNSPALLWYVLQSPFSASALKLLELGGDATLKNNSDVDAALGAAMMGNLQFLKALRHKEIATNRPFPWHNRCVYFKGDQANEVKNATAVHLAAINDSVSCLEFYVEEGIFTDLNIEAEHGWTPLHMAAKGDRGEAIAFLLSHGANINVEGPKKSLPLHIAVQYRCVQAVKVLMKFGSAMALDGNGMRPLDHAEQLAFPELVSILTVEKSTSDISASRALQSTRIVGEMGAKYLEAAIVEGNIDMCQSLIKRGVSLESRMPSCHYCSPLLSSLRLGKLDIVRWLLDSGASARGVYCKSHWAKYWASSVSAVDAACCLENSAQFLPELLTKYIDEGAGWLYSTHNPLHTATAARNKPAVDTFLAHVKENPGAHLTTNNVTGIDNLDPITQLLAAYVNQLSDDYDLVCESPLHVAIFFEQLDIAETLLGHGADINLKNGLGATPLHLAAVAGNLTTTEFLLDRAALMESRDENLNTPLITAIVHGKFEVAKFLIKRGANTAVKNQTRQNLLQLICNRNGEPDLKMFAYLLDMGVDPTEISDLRACALHDGLINRGYLNLILREGLMDRAPPLPIDEFSLRDPFEGLLYAISRMHRCMPVGQLRSIIDIESPGKTSLLCKVAAAGLLDGMELLFKIGANMEHEGCEHGTALMAACSMGEFDAVSSLVRRGARLAYKSGKRTRSAVVCARPFPKIVQWLLVKRFLTQQKLEFSGLVDAPRHEVQPWSGVGVGRLDLKGGRRRKWDESSIEYAERLCDYRIAWLGEILPLYDRLSADG